MHILSCLQEVTFNVDGVSLAKPQTAPQFASKSIKALEDLEDVELNLSSCFNASRNAGDKSVLGSGIDRIRDFAKFVFEREEDVIVAAGHSLYFKHFFRTFLPHSSDHTAKNRKMKNCAVVSFVLQKKGDNYRIKPESIEANYLGFEEKASVRRRKPVGPEHIKQAGL